MRVLKVKKELCFFIWFKILLLNCMNIYLYVCVILRLGEGGYFLILYFF